MEAGEHTVCSPAAVIATLTYKPGWKFKIAGPRNSLLCVYAETADSTNSTRTRVTQHQFPLPPPCPHQDFVRWVYLCLLLAERHEAGEFFRVDGHAPFWPGHQGEDPYAWTERWDDQCP